MGFFDFFKPKKKTRSAGRGSGSGKTVSQTAKSVVSSISSDIKMGMSTFGMSKAAQAQKLSEMGYSPSAIDSYQARTAATQERMRQQSLAQSQRDDNDKPAKPAAPKKTQAEIKKETEIAEGQARRKKFEQEAAERRRKFKARTGPRLLFSSLSLNS